MIEFIFVVRMETPGPKINQEISNLKLNGGAWYKNSKQKIQEMETPGLFKKISNPITSGFHNRPIPIEINLS